MVMVNVALDTSTCAACARVNTRHAVYMHQTDKHVCIVLERYARRHIGSSFVV